MTTRLSASSPAGKSVGCLGENEILRFVEGQMDARERAAVEVHARGCATCEQLLALALAAGAGARSDAPRASDDALDELVPRGTLLGRYTVLGLLGRGGMGDVHAAYDSQLDRRVALKLLRDCADDDAGRGEARLLREARAIARLSHRNVIVVHDVGSVGGRVFVAMEYVEGQTLSSWLRSKKRSPAEILAVFVEASQGLAAAHAGGLVHRDFKPQNVMVGTDGTVRVTDFGLVRSVNEGLAPVEAPERGKSDADPSLTRTGELVGTPLYMSPSNSAAPPPTPGAISSATASPSTRRSMESTRSRSAGGWPS